ncbi:hypothetical protein [Methanobrevibacter curvatus]|uniref:Uncharacterized protein n=1 Tax=Methanobrevibacter curvatus TaxID=49547 RepID=A0A162FFB0_9EURY|nr:hypothetical protein [Methanobrevibacter curvatus]KZX12255.1 hypothetical protein MBCUR_11070 [Methanobrevibacter curvatus]
MKYTQNQNYIKKPSCFAREPQDEFNYESRISPGTSKAHNNTKGIFYILFIPLFLLNKIVGVHL